MISMKNYLKVILLVGAFVSICYWSSVEISRQSSSLVLLNIEALANNESSMNTDCVGIGSVDCPINHAKVEYVMQGYSLGE